MGWLLIGALLAFGGWYVVRQHGANVESAGGPWFTFEEVLASATSAGQAVLEAGAGALGIVTEKVRQIAEAIATAEGYFEPGSIPQRANNPGDLVLGDRGLGTLGRAGITVFATAEDGWNALFHQVQLMVTGQSSVYKPGMTWLEIAVPYTGNDNAVSWAANVTRRLGVRSDETLLDFLNV